MLGNCGAFTIKIWINNKQNNNNQNNLLRTNQKLFCETLHKSKQEETESPILSTAT